MPAQIVKIYFHGCIIRGCIGIILDLDINSIPLNDIYNQMIFKITRLICFCLLHIKYIYGLYQVDKNRDFSLRIYSNIPMV